jgi:fructosamine-3-kinase
MSVEQLIKGSLKESGQFSKPVLRFLEQNAEGGKALVFEGDERYFLKFYTNDYGISMLDAELKGLYALKVTETIKIPGIKFHKWQDNLAMLLTEFIETAPGDPEAEYMAGLSLAELHLRTNDMFGWHEDNYIGPLPQSNDRNPVWADFYYTNRIHPQLQLAEKKGLLKKAEFPETNNWSDYLNLYLSDVRPVLLHGDLWGGNILYSRQKEAFFIDPSVYYGDGLVDIAMSMLFGGFGPSFYQAYQSVIPPTDFYHIKIKLYQLYYELVHLNLFGLYYKPGVLSTLGLIRQFRA